MDFAIPGKQIVLSSRVAVPHENAHSTTTSTKYSGGPESTQCTAALELEAGSGLKARH